MFICKKLIGTILLLAVVSLLDSVSGITCYSCGEQTTQGCREDQLVDCSQGCFNVTAITPTMSGYTYGCKEHAGAIEEIAAGAHLRKVGMNKCDYVEMWGYRIELCFCNRYKCNESPSINRMSFNRIVVAIACSVIVPVSFFNMN